MSREGEAEQSREQSNFRGSSNFNSNFAFSIPIYMFAYYECNMLILVARAKWRGRP